ncbi:hypothetical protein G7046_g3731 [Stylonectria norvegica]|nr:hypothetical protein G7046_g3731 [Stylonectria norvegica]
MASPQSTSADEAPASSKNLEQITFRFCSECSNMLYPKEDTDAHKLQFTCRTCQYTEEAVSTCVFRNVLNTSQGETAGVTQDVGSDPTVSEASSITCSICGFYLKCKICGELCTEMVTNYVEEDGQWESRIWMPWGDSDPFADYDEEMEESPFSYDTGDTTDEASPITYEEFRASFESEPPKSDDK